MEKGPSFSFAEIHHLLQASTIIFGEVVMAFSGDSVKTESLGLSVFHCVGLEHLFPTGGGFPQSEE